MPLPHSRPQSPSFLGHVVRYELSRLAPGTRMASSQGISFILSTSRRKRDAGFPERSRKPGFNGQFTDIYSFEITIVTNFAEVRVRIPASLKIFRLSFRKCISFHYVDTSVLLENIPLIKFRKTTSGTRVVYFP